MKIETERLIIKEFSLNMAKDLSLNSLDEDTIKFLPDEVFETEEDAKQIIKQLMLNYKSLNSPLVYPLFTKDKNKNIGYVEIVKTKDEYEIGYHIAKTFTRNGYATEALRAFIPEITKKLNINEIQATCLKENIASTKVLEKCKFKKIYEGIGKYQGEDRKIISYTYNIENK